MNDKNTPQDDRSVSHPEDDEDHPLNEHPEYQPSGLAERLDVATSNSTKIDAILDQRTIDTTDTVDDKEFFTDDDGQPTVVTRYDMEKTLDSDRKLHYKEVERYWVNKPYVFVSIFHSTQENEKKYYVFEPYLTDTEETACDFLTDKLKTSIRYSDDDVVTDADDNERRDVIERETKKLLARFDLYRTTNTSFNSVLSHLPDTVFDYLPDHLAPPEETDDRRQGSAARPEAAIDAEDPDTLTDHQVEKLLYYLKRDFIGYERIDGITHDVNVEDISCDGYNSPVFVYHSEYEQLITNIYHGDDQLDDFVVKLAQRSDQGISKRTPQVDATLPNGSRAQLTLGKEVSDHGTNYTIRQFKDVPFTPVDLINWNTFSLDQMAFLWLAIENNRSLIFAGGTASGKTTSLNAVSLFIPSNSKIVSIEDTREVELPQRNWIASVTRPSFSDDGKGDVDEFALLEAALRQRPEYIVMGEIRGEEGRTLFQVMSTGHTTYTTFHADSVGEVLKRFTTDPINVSKTMFTALDLVSIQTQTRVNGNKVRRNKTITEVNDYDPESDEINVKDVYTWDAERDEYNGFENTGSMADVETLDEIRFDRGWSYDRLERELRLRRLVLAYLIENGLNTYTEVAATIQAFLNDPDTILTLIANGDLEDRLDSLRRMESVLIDIDPEKEELVPRPDASDEKLQTARETLDACSDILAEYEGEEAGSLAASLPSPSDIAGDTISPDDSTDRAELEQLLTTEYAAGPDAAANDEFDWADGAEPPGADTATDGEDSVGDT